MKYGKWNTQEELDFELNNPELFKDPRPGFFEGENDAEHFFCFILGSLVLTTMYVFLKIIL